MLSSQRPAVKIDGNPTAYVSEKWYGGRVVYLVHVQHGPTSWCLRDANGVREFTSPFEAQRAADWYVFEARKAGAR